MSKKQYKNLLNLDNIDRFMNAFKDIPQDANSIKEVIDNSKSIIRDMDLSPEGTKRLPDVIESLRDEGLKQNSTYSEFAKPYNKVFAQNGVYEMMKDVALGRDTNETIKNYFNQANANLVKDAKPKGPAPSPPSNKPLPLTANQVQPPTRPAPELPQKNLEVPNRQAPTLENSNGAPTRLAPQYQAPDSPTPIVQPTRPAPELPQKKLVVPKRPAPTPNQQELSDIDNSFENSGGEFGKSFEKYNMPELDINRDDPFGEEGFFSNPNNINKDETLPPRQNDQEPILSDSASLEPTADSKLNDAKIPLNESQPQPTSINPSNEPLPLSPQALSQPHTAPNKPLPVEPKTSPEAPTAINRGSEPVTQNPHTTTQNESLPPEQGASLKTSPQASQSNNKFTKEQIDAQVRKPLPNIPSTSNKTPPALPSKASWQLKAIEAQPQNTQQPLASATKDATLGASESAKVPLKTSDITPKKDKISAKSISKSAKNIAAKMQGKLIRQVNKVSGKVSDSKAFAPIKKVYDKAKNLGPKI